MGRIIGQLRRLEVETLDAVSIVVDELEVEIVANIDALVAQSVESDAYTELGVAGHLSPIEAVGAIVYHSTTQPTTTGVQVAALFDSETVDTYGFHSTVINTSRLTVPTGLDGTYLVSTQLTFGSNAAGIRWLILRKNGGGIAQVEVPPVIGDRTNIAASWPIPLVATDYVEVFALQDSGGNLNIGFDPAVAELVNKFSLYRL